MKQWLLIFIALCNNQSDAQISLNNTLDPLYKTICVGWIRNYAIEKKPDSCLLAIDYYLKQMRDSAEICEILAITEIDDNIKDPRWLTIRAELFKDLPRYYPPSLNTNVFTQLLRFAHQDQYVRFILMNIKNDKSKKPEQVAEIRVMDTLNLKHLGYVDSLLSHNFRFSNKTVGDGGMEALFLFITHCQDTVRQTRYMPLMKQWVDSGNLKKNYYAIFIDKVKINHHQPQQYGTQYLYDDLSDQLVLNPVADISNLNSRRKLMDMEPIQVELITVERLEHKKFSHASVEEVLRKNKTMDNSSSRLLPYLHKDK